MGDRSLTDKEFITGILSLSVITSLSYHDMTNFYILHLVKSATSEFQSELGVFKHITCLWFTPFVGFL